MNINYPSTYTALATSSILGYYNHSHVDIGLRRPFTNSTFFDFYYYEHGEYASKVAYHWSRYASLPWMDVESTWDPVQLYRKLLSEADDGVTIASIGFLENVSSYLKFHSFYFVYFLSELTSGTSARSLSFFRRHQIHSRRYRGQISSQPRFQSLL